MPAGAATRMSVSSSKWSETGPSSDHSSRPRASTRSAAPEPSRHASSHSHHESGHWPTSSHQSSSSRHASSSHHDSGRSSHHPSASQRDSQSHGSSNKSSMVLVRDKSTGKSLLQRALTGASRTRDSRDPTHESSRHSSSTRDHGPRTSSSSHPLELTRGHSSTRARSQTQAACPKAPGFETRLERIEEGMQRNKEPATARPTVVVVQQQATPQRFYGHDAFCAGYMAAKRGQ